MKSFMVMPGARNNRNGLNPIQLTLVSKDSQDTETILTAMKGYFITGTDTGVGKTLVSLALMHALQAQGKSVAGMKPVSAGCINTDSGLRNDDAVRLQKAASVEIPYDVVNPYAFEPPIAPHIAARSIGERISVEKIMSCYQTIGGKVDIVIVEGAGGWLVPLNDRETMADIAAHLELPVILVVGMRLGCLNHALLSAENILAKGAKLAGWIANQIDRNMLKSNENISSLEALIHAPLSGVIPWSNVASPAVISQHINTKMLSQSIN